MDAINLAAFITMEGFQLTQKAIDALKAVRQAITIDGGNSFDMTDWCGVGPCGTTCCIGGHLAVLAGATPSPELWPGRGRYNAVFVLNGAPVECADIVAEQFLIPGDAPLFHRSHWDHDLYFMYQDDPVRAAQLAIDRFILKYSPSEREREQAQPVETAERASTHNSGNPEVYDAIQLPFPNARTASHMVQRDNAETPEVFMAQSRT